MKFGKYLQATLTPEWKKAYIDYRALKKCINVIREVQEGLQATFDSPIGSKSHLPVPGYDEPAKAVDGKHNIVVCSPHPTQTHFVDTRLSYCSCTTVSSSVHDGVEYDIEDSPDDDDLPAPPGISTPESRSHSPDVRTIQRTLAPPMPAFILDRRGRGFYSAPSSTVSFASIRRLDDINIAINPFELSRKLGHPMSTLPLDELLPLLSKWERSFFDLLDQELEKVESFYLEQETKLRERGAKLERQLGQLSRHKPFYQLERRSDILAFASSFVLDKLPGNRSTAKIDVANMQSTNSLGLTLRGDHSMPDLAYITSDGDGSGSKSSSSRPADPNNPESKPIQRAATRVGSYQQARKQLKKAMLEHYRALEMLDNYRALNTIGFQKALKKFEKVTKIPSVQAYLHEKIAPSAFAKGEGVNDMMRDMERLFTSLFEDGDKKKPTDYLRGNMRSRPHHFSTFRTGLMLGIALPAFISGVYYALQKQVDGWDSLLYVYGILSLPPIFALLVGLNIQAWSRHRINYQFIFDLDTRTQLDNRQYFEAPTFVFATLVYAFWLSFSGVFGGYVHARQWPLVWLALVACVMFNPLPLLFKPSRWWLLKIIAKVLSAGFHAVEFADFWLADQLCSLSFTLSNVYFVGCTYAGGQSLDTAFQRCGSSATHHKGIWVGIFFLAAMPTIIRLVQSIRRWRDSQNKLHLVNAGKYGAAILTFLFWYKWRSLGYHSGGYYGTWITFSLISSVYAGLWDIYMDWSFFGMKSKHRLLREELIYSKFIPLYYFAIISNSVFKFTWFIYIPTAGPRMEVRSLIVAFLEILRRFQWNFIRVENEHIGNVDQYQATKELKLPYTVDDL